MKLKVNEFCVHCQRYVDFEFLDTRMKQIVYCPNCKKEHYRQLPDEVRLRMQICKLA